MAMTQSDQSAANMRRAIIVLICASVILLVGNGIRTSFGLFLVPMTTDLGWSRESYSLALAIQNIMWGLSQPIAGAYADKLGDRKVIAVSIGLYAAGLLLIAHTSDPLDFAVNGGVLIGIAMSGTGIPIMLSVVGRLAPESRRSLFLGVAGSAGALGQATVVHGVQYLLHNGGWGLTMLVLAAASAALIPLAAAFAGRMHGKVGAAGESSAPGARAMAAPREEPSMGRAIRAAGRNDGFWYLNGGFFVCGFHVIFIQTHLPAFIADAGLAPNLAAVSISVIAIGNILGSVIAGMLGERYRKRTVLSGLYLGRAVIIAVFVLSPVSEVSVIVFSFAIGLVWLSTVPLTTGLVAQLFGIRYLATLFGLVFVGHQLGSFLGAWLGGYVYDATGSYDIVWWVAVALGVVAAVLHWPIREPRPRLRFATAQA